MSAPLRIEQQGSLWTFVLQRADKRNALSAELVEQLLAGVAQAHAAHAQVLVFRGEGRNFSAGFDFSDLEQHSDGDLLLRFVRIETLLQAVAASRCLTVGLAHGKNFGAGVDLFAVCRRRIAAADATFRMPGLKFGLVLGTRRFSQIVGPDRAARIQEQAATFDAEQALEMGFVHEIQAPERWHDTVAQAQSDAKALDDDGRAALYRALSSPQAEADMAALVLSASRPGLRERVRRYLAPA
jgi:enoyl-CoA hydratase/carnithine racemase